MSISSQPIFYVYVKHVESNVTFIGIFPSRFVADEWWRAVSDKASPLCNNIYRVTPQFYTQKTLSDVADSLQDPKCAARFKDRVLFELANGTGTAPFNLIPPDHTRELRSHRTYYIRSCSDPLEFWYDSPAGLCVSRTERTLFGVQRLGDGLDDTVMIASDEIRIWVGPYQSLSIQESVPDADGMTEKVVRTGDGNPVFKLAQFLEAGFFAVRGNDPRMLVKELGQGEAWELV